MKYDLGRCLLHDRLHESGMTIAELAATLLYRQERLLDYMDNKRMMPLKTAITIADTIGCDVKNLYELIPNEKRVHK